LLGQYLANTYVAGAPVCSGAQFSKALLDCIDQNGNGGLTSEELVAAARALRLNLGGSTPPPPGSTPPPSGGGTAPERLKLTISRTFELRRALAKGIRLKLACPTACRVSAKLVLSGKLAHKLRLSRRRKADHRPVFRSADRQICGRMTRTPMLHTAPDRIGLK